MALIIQCQNKFAPWIDEEFIQSKIRDDMHDKAKISDSHEEWQKSRAQRNLVTYLNK